MKILVLGGTGAMGASLVPILAEGGNEVSVTSRLQRKSDNEKIRYIQGNAHDLPFLREVFSQHWDVVVDFMVYTTDEFRERLGLLLNATDHYVFLSSSRVYADSKTPITEDSPRLLDVCKDEVYLKTDEYALSKAREEDLLRESGKSNWTIIRPYITYSSERLQLGVYEKELWLYRALHGQTVVIPGDILSHTTTLTWAEDVAKGIAALIGTPKAYGETFHITALETIRWSEVLELYQRVFQDVTGKSMAVKTIESSEEMGEVIRKQYQIKYDRLFDRKFDNAKFIQAAGEENFISPKNGLEKCLREFLVEPKFLRIPNPAVMDKIAKEKTKISMLPSKKEKMKYLAVRYLPNYLIRHLESVLKLKK